MRKTALVLGGHGFIGHHMARRLKQEGYWVRTVDIKEFPYNDTFKDEIDDYVVEDLRNYYVCKYALKAPNGNSFDRVYQFSAWMGGAGVIFSGDHDAQVMHDSALLNVNISQACSENKPGKIFYSSSACCYNQCNQTNTDNPQTNEDSAYPAWPDSPYGWEKIFAEQLWQAFARNHGLSVKIGRFHNVYGPEGAWGNGREKSPAAMCRKVAQTPDGGEIEIWGDGEQTRSFLYIDECLEGVQRLMNSAFNGPVNIGSDEMVSINQLVGIVKDIAGKPGIRIKHIDGPLGVRGRTSDNKLIKEKLGWAPDYPLRKGLEKTFPWINEQVKAGKQDYSWTS